MRHELPAGMRVTGDGQPLTVMAEMQRVRSGSPVEEGPACFLLDVLLEGIP